MYFDILSEFSNRGPATYREIHNDNGVRVFASSKKGDVYPSVSWLRGKFLTYAGPNETVMIVFTENETHSDIDSLFKAGKIISDVDLSDMRLVGSGFVKSERLDIQTGRYPVAKGVSKSIMYAPEARDEDTEILKNTLKSILTIDA